MLSIDIRSPGSRSTLQRELRSNTRAALSTIEHRISRFDLTRPEDYGMFLHVQHAALLGLKGAWPEADHRDFKEMTRRLQADLHLMGMTMPHIQAPAPVLPTDADRLGAAYVIRGSRRTAGVLRHRVAPDFARSYLGFVPTVSWTQFLARLDASVSNDLAHLAVIRGARAALQMISHLLAQALG
jgi:heme oxygenase